MAQAFLPTELQSPYLWNLVDSNHVLGILSPTHTPCLPRFHQLCRSKRIRTSDLRFWRPTFYQLNYTSITRKQKDSNLRSLLARHLSRVLFSTAQPCFLCFDIAKVDSRYAVFLRNKKFFSKKIFLYENSRGILLFICKFAY